MTTPITTKRRTTWIVATVVAAAALTAAGALWAGDKPGGKGLPDLLGTQRALPPGAMHVEDVAADIDHFKGVVTIRGVVASGSPTDPTLFSMIDSREARVCSDLHCAKNYLAVRMKGALPKPWDEVNVRGTIAVDAQKGFRFVQAEGVDNLGSIK